MPPPLPPTPIGTPSYPSQGPKVVIELYLDLNCPFSKKAFKTLYQDGIIKDYEGQSIQFMFQNVIQPWHPTGAMMHEVHLAVRSINPEASYAYANVVYDHMEAFGDEATLNKTRAQINEELIALAESIGINREALTEKLTIKGGTTPTTQALKWATKYNRTRGVHVTPTIFVNGLEAGDVSSSWTVAQWKEFLDKLLSI